jgi:hypothetical protein
MRTKPMLLGAVGMLTLQALLVVGYLSVSKQDPSSSTPIGEGWSQTVS